MGNLAYKVLLTSGSLYVARSRRWEFWVPDLEARFGGLVCLPACDLIAFALPDIVLKMCGLLKIIVI